MRVSVRANRKQSSDDDQRARQHVTRQRTPDPRLDLRRGIAAQRPGAVRRTDAPLGDDPTRVLAEFELDLP
jgi:hypothetical protein